MVKPRTLRVRVDGGKQIGLGHIIRCLSLSKIICSLFDEVVFYIEQPEATTVDLVAQANFDVIPIQESHDFLRFLKKGNMVLLDGYHFDYQYELNIRNVGCKIITIDDLQHRRFCSDVIINHTPGINVQNYLTEPYTRIYSGLQYALIRQEFIKAARREKAPDSLSKVFLCFGGADPENFTLQYYRFLINTLPSLKRIHIVVGPSYRHLNSLKEEVRDNSLVSIYHNVTPDKLIALITSSDCTVVSSSTISIECMKLAVPMYLVKTAENQTGNYNYLLKQGCAAKVEVLPSYTFSFGEKMLLQQADEFGERIEENLKSIFQEAITS